MNRMCIDCRCRGVDCAGTDNQTWTGCIYRQPKPTAPAATSTSNHCETGRQVQCAPAAPRKKGESK